MKIYSKILFFFLSFFGCFFSFKAYTQTQQICSLNNVPQGWVIVDRISCICCGGTNGMKGINLQIELPTFQKLATLHYKL